MCTFVFFFSSRRRHTRYWRDWSSDVCSSDLDKENGNRIVAVDKLLFVDYTGNQVVPSLAKSWEVLDGGRTFKFKLHTGTKWSDGQPFTADHILFLFEVVYQNKELSPLPTHEKQFNGKVGTLEEADELIVLFK